MTKSNQISIKDCWIAKDKDGSVFLYSLNEKPYRRDSTWHNYALITLSREIFDITYFDNIPWKESLHKIVDGKIVKEPEYDFDEPVLVSSNNKYWRIRYFSHISESGEYMFFSCGATSLSNNLNSFTPYEYHKKYDIDLARELLK